MESSFPEFLPLFRQDLPCGNPPEDIYYQYDIIYYYYKKQDRAQHSAVFSAQDRAVFPRDFPFLSDTITANRMR